MKWTEEQTVEIEKMFADLGERDQNKLDVRAMMVFTNLHMVGLAEPNLPGVLFKCDRTQLAQMRMLAILFQSQEPVHEPLRTLDPSGLGREKKPTD